MRINEIRKSIIQSSSKEYIDEMTEYLCNGNFANKGIVDVEDLFAYSYNNKSKRDEEDFKYFYDKVAYIDFCKFNNMGHNALAAKKYLAAAFNPKTREFSYNSNKFYKEGNTNLDTILVLNVKGKEIYKVLTSIYTCLRDNGIDNCITIPSFNRFEEGLTDSIRISINAADMERVINLINDLPLPIINLIDKPNILYPRVNDYIGYDRYFSQFDGVDARVSRILCGEISYALFSTTIDYINNDGNEKIENGEETILEYRKKCLAEDKPLVECDLRILQRMISIDPSNKDLFKKNLRDALLGTTKTKSAYINKETNELFDDIYGRLDDESILYDESLEFNVEAPVVEVEDLVKAAAEMEEEFNKGTDIVAAADNDLLVTEEQPKDLLVTEEQPKDLLVTEEQSKDLLVQEEQSKELMVAEEQQDLLVQEPKEEVKKEESLYESFMNRSGSSEEYLNSLLANAMSGAKAPEEQGTVSKEETVQEEEIGTEGSSEEIQVSSAVEEQEVAKEDVHFYDDAANVGEAFVVESAPAEEIVQGKTQEEQGSELVRPEDMTEEQKKLVRDTFAELPQEDSRFLNYLDDVLSKLPDTGLNIESISEQAEETLDPMEVQSLSSNALDQQMTYERALKYKDLVRSINVLNTKVRGTDFTLLDYFDQQQLLTRIKPNGRYMIITDEVYSGLEVVEECVIKYVANHGNVPLDKIIEEWGIQELQQQEKQDKPKGLKGLFKRKRS